MEAPRFPLLAGRGFARRLIELPCELYTRTDDGPRLAWGTNLSESGIFVETTTPVALGEDVVVCFRPTSGWQSSELTLFAKVARAACGRRRDDVALGVGLRFLDLSRPERRELTRWLRPRLRTPEGMRKRNPAPQRPAFEAWSEHPFASRIS